MQLGQTPEGFRSGFASIVGRPNAGKSTLINRICGEKVSIISSRPQTTRNAIRGILTEERMQLVLIDTPGLHKPTTVLGSKLNDAVRATLSEVDIVVFVIDSSQEVGRGDAFIAEELKRLGTPVVCVLSKREIGRDQLAAAQSLGDWDATVELSAKTGQGVRDLLDALYDRIPEGPLWYPPDTVTDQPERVIIAELIREKALELTHEEVPHSIAVTVEDVRSDDPERVEVDARIWVEHDSQKGIVIGARGAMLKEIGKRARRDIERLLGSHIYLHLTVKVEKNWQRREGMVGRFGYGK